MNELLIKQKLEDLVIKTNEVLKNKIDNDILLDFFNVDKLKDYYLDNLSFLGFCEKNEINQDVISNFKYLEDNKIIIPIEICKGLNGDNYSVYIDSQIILMLLIDKEYRASNFKKDISKIIEENKNKLVEYNNIAINLKIIEILMRLLFSDKIRLSKTFKKRNSIQFEEAWIMDKLNVLYKPEFEKINTLLFVDVGILKGYEYELADYSILNRVINNKTISYNYLKNLYKAPLIEFEFINQIIHFINQYILIFDRNDKFSLNDVLLKLQTPSGYKSCLNCFKLFKVESNIKKFTCCKRCSEDLKNKIKTNKRNLLKLNNKI